MSRPRRKDSPAATKSAQHLMHELYQGAETLDAVPLQIEAALDSGSPQLAMRDIEGVLTRMRGEGLQSIFRDEGELRQFCRIMAERILANTLSITERTLVKIAAKLEDSDQPLRVLTLILDSLTRQESALATAFGHAMHPPERAAPSSDAELRAAVVAAEAKVRQLAPPE